MTIFSGIQFIYETFAFSSHLMRIQHAATMLVIRLKHRPYFPTLFSLRTVVRSYEGKRGDRLCIQIRWQCCTIENKNRVKDDNIKKVKVSVYIMNYIAMCLIEQTLSEISHPLADFCQIDSTTPFTGSMSSQASRKYVQVMDKL